MESLEHLGIPIEFRRSNWANFAIKDWRAAVPLEREFYCNFESYSETTMKLKAFVPKLDVVANELISPGAKWVDGRSSILQKEMNM
ncbi:unnamed protein product, partial [Ilex paraguariensis]